MFFSVIAHSSLYMESGGASLLVDPWLFGSCYWRSWWPYPPVGDIEPAWLEPDYIYLTHHHFDHFHYPTLRRLSKSAHVLVPRFAVDFMAGELKRIGFSDVTEIAHGDPLALAPHFTVTSYQFGFDDSAMVARDRTATLADFNDCKIRGRPMKEIVDHQGPPTFLLRNHSWAQAYPQCYSSPEPRDLKLLNRNQYLADFIHTVREARPAFAIPFASNVCFLHPQTKAFNQLAITPFEVQEAFAKANIDGTELIIMGPKDSWSAERGFELRDWTEAFEHRSERIEVLAREVGPTIQESLATEASKRLSSSTLEAHFGRFLLDLPRGVAWVLPKPVVFAVRGDEEVYWVLDFKARRVYGQKDLPVSYASVTRMDEGLLADAIDKNIVGMVHVAMRLSVDLSPGSIRVDLMFWAFLAIWELGYLPLRRSINRRSLAVAWRRRQEFLDGLGGKLFGRGPLLERMASLDGRGGRRGVSA